MAVTVLPPGTHVIYFGRVRDEYAESYMVEGPCDCPQCPRDPGQPRYRLRGEHVRYDRDSGSYERVGGADLIHVDASHVVPSPEGAQPWQINQQILRELGVPATEWM
jgi:hypothetical protein